MPRNSRLKHLLRYIFLRECALRSFSAVSHAAAMIFAVRFSHFKALRKGTRPLFTSKTPQGIRKIIDACCDLEPSLRPTSRELLTLIRALRPRRQQISSDGRWRPDAVNTSSNWWSSMSCLPARMNPDRKAAAKVVWDRLAEAKEKQASLVAQAASAAEPAT